MIHKNAQLVRVVIHKVAWLVTQVLQILAATVFLTLQIKILITAHKQTHQIQCHVLSAMMGTL